MAQSATTRGTRLCFVIMPFGDRKRDPDKHEMWTELYEDVIHPTVEESDQGLCCLKANEIARPGNIVRDIVEHLYSADLVIAEMTDQNPNVFYELGVRHSLAGPTILISQDLSDVLFDLRGYRIIPYRFSPRGVEEFKDELRKHIHGALNSCTPDNPVTEYLEAIQQRRDAGAVLGPHAGTENRELLEQMESIRRQNATLLSTVEQLHAAITAQSGIRDTAQPDDLIGTWKDTSFPGHDEHYAALVDHKLLMTYEGRWPGFQVGDVQGNLVTFSWQRFDHTLGGSGFFQASEDRTRLTGGIWFSDEDVEKNLRRGRSVVEFHELVKVSTTIPSHGIGLLDTATQEARKVGLLD